MMRRLFITAILLAIMTAMLSPVVGINAEAREKVQENADLVIWVGFEERELETLQAIAHNFSVEKGKKVWIIQKPFFQLKTQFPEQAKLGKGPDIIICPNDWTGQYAREGLISPLGEDEFSGKQRSVYNPVGLKALSMEEKLYGFPFFMETIALFYNKKLVKTKPATMEALLKTAGSLNNPSQGRAGLIFKMDDFYMSWPFFSGFGACIFEKGGEGKVKLNSPESVSALKYLAEMRKKLKLKPGGMKIEEIQAKFSDGKAVFIIDGPWALKTYRRNMLDFGVMDFPPMKDGKRPRPFVGVHAFMISSRCKARPLAVSFLHHLNSAGNQQAFCDIGDRIPGRMDALKLMKGSENIQVFAQIAKNGEPLPNNPLMASVWPAMEQVLKAVVFQGKDPKEMLDKKLGKVKK